MSLKEPQKGSPLVKVLKWLVLGVVFGVSASCMIDVQKYLDSSKPLPRGSKNYQSTYKILLLSVMIAVVAGILMKHIMLDLPRKQALSIDLTTTSFKGYFSSTMVIDLYFLGSLSMVIAIKDAVGLGHWSMFLWAVFYAEMGVLLGICVYCTVFFCHIEYLASKYKHGETCSIMDHLLFLAINLAIAALVVFFALRTPHALLVFKEHWQWDPLVSALMRV